MYTSLVLPSFLPSLTYLPTYLTSYLSFFLPYFLPTYPPIYLPTVLNAYFTNSHFDSLIAFFTFNYNLRFFPFTTSVFLCSFFFACLPPLFPRLISFFTGLNHRSYPLTHSHSLSLSLSILSLLHTRFLLVILTCTVNS